MNGIEWLLLASAGLSWFVAKAILLRAKHLQLMQSPNHRSSHLRPTASGGGLGIVVAGLIASAWLAWSGATQLWFVLALSLPLAWIGLHNDISHLSAKLRLAVQLIVVTGLLLALDSLPPLALWEGTSLDGWLLLGLLFLVGAWWVNLFNFMDGIDGIAGTQAVFMLLIGSGLAVWAIPAATASPVWILMLIIAAATVGFLVLNWPPAKIFMGDVGSTWLAFMIIALALLSIQAGWLSYTAWLVLAAAFVTDTTVTLLNRMVHGDRWYEAHRSHAYQRLSRRWNGDHQTGSRSVTLIVAAINLLWLAPCAWASLRWPEWALGWVVLAYAPIVAGVVALGAGKHDDA